MSSLKKAAIFFMTIGVPSVLVVVGLAAIFETAQLADTLDVSTATALCMATFSLFAMEITDEGSE